MPLYIKGVTHKKGYFIYSICSIDNKKLINKYRPTYIKTWDSAPRTGNALGVRRAGAESLKGHRAPGGAGPAECCHIFAIKLKQCHRSLFRLPPVLIAHLLELLCLITPPKLRKSLRRQAPVTNKVFSSH